jgi:hypothetical protein
MAAYRHNGTMGEEVGEDRLRLIGEIGIHCFDRLIDPFDGDQLRRHPPPAFGKNRFIGRKPHRPARQPAGLALYAVGMVDEAGRSKIEAFHGVPPFLGWRAQIGFIPVTPDLFRGPPGGKRLCRKSS